MHVLGIESSCDETATAVLAPGVYHVPKEIPQGKVVIGKRAIERDDPEPRLERGERVVRDLGARGRHCGDEAGLARAGEADERDVRDGLEFEDDVARKTMLQVFSVLGSDHLLVGEYRRKLAGALN